MGVKKLSDKSFEEAREKFGKWLRVKRAELHPKSQGDIAKELGYQNANFISAIERGMATPPMDKISEYADAYKVNENEFAEMFFQTLYPEIYYWIKELH